ncbi:hypothetical protein ACFCW2_04430 [Qipengyuania sp. DSG2-2]|uniref:hypothetical protein n=1 Tax=Qipengyuania sp. DGS2-2 TaxID=3349631 RepID=UPI0036D3BA1B
MGLVILIVIGAVLGWLVTIILNIEDAQRVGMHILIGSGGSLLAGLAISSGEAVTSLSPIGLFAGIAGSGIGLVLYRVFQRTEIR